MPNCKYCHKTISTFDNDICPHCGALNPIEEDYKTKDITSFIDPVSGEYKLYKSKSKKTFLILNATLGIFGASYFYLGFLLKGFICLFSSLVLILGIGFALFFTCLNNAFAFLIPFFALICFYLIRTIFLSKDDTLKDKNGEFLR